MVGLGLVGLGDSLSVFGYGRVTKGLPIVKGFISKIVTPIVRGWGLIYG